MMSSPNKPNRIIFFFRLCMNYQLKPGEISVAELYKSYEEYCSANGLFPATKCTVGIVLNKLWPNLQINKKKDQLHYEGLGVRCPLERRSISLPSHWIVNELKDKYLSVTVPTQYFVNEECVTYELTIDNGLIGLTFKGRFIDLEDFGIGTKIEQPINQCHIDAFALILDRFQPCSGFPYDPDMPLGRSMEICVWQDMMSGCPERRIVGKKKCRLLKGFGSNRETTSCPSCGNAFRSLKFYKNKASNRYNWFNCNIYLRPLV